MHESPNPNPEPKPRNESTDSVEWYPSEEELRQFEEARNLQFGTDRSIDGFISDKEAGPTEEDYEAQRFWNESMSGPRPFKNLTFEDYFGRPDPRSPREANPVSDEHEQPKP
jgi:hypothetical protein